MMNLWLSGLQLAGTGATRTIAVLPEGIWHTDKYGDLDLSAPVLDAIIEAHEAGMPPQGAFIDLNHDFGKSHGSVLSVKRGTYTDPSTGEKLPGLVAEVQFTEEGAQLIDSGAYGFVSAAFGPMTDVKTGTKYPHVLRAISLTNTPVLGILGRIGEGVGIAASEQDALVCLADVLDEMRRAKQEPVPAEKQAAAWGMWDATGAFERLVREAIADGLEGEDLRARIAELAADLPAAVIESIQRSVEDANSGAVDNMVPAPTEQVDPLLSDNGDDPVALLMARFDSVMAEADDIVKGTAGVRSMRALATETKKKLQALLTKKGGTTSMLTDQEIQELQERARRADALEQQLAEQSRATRSGAVATVLTKLSEAGLAEPARNALGAILLAEGETVMLSENETPVADALVALADIIEFVPITLSAEGAAQDPPAEEITLSDADEKLRIQLGVSTEAFIAARAAEQNKEV